jgi:MGT family glycosyltransferase
VAKALFFGLPVHGHVNPTLPLVRELVRRGEQVVYFATDEFAARIAETGATYRPYRNAFLPDLGTIARRMDELVWLFMRTSSEVLDQELDAYRAEKPDYVLTDSVASWGHWIGEILDVPVVTSVTTFAFNRKVLRYAVAQGVRPQGGRYVFSKLRHVVKALGLRRRLRRRYGVRGPGLLDVVSGRAGFALVYTSREFQPCAATFDDRFGFVGPLVEPRPDSVAFPWERITHPTVVYVSLGTLFNANPAFYQSCFETFRPLDLQVVLSVGSRIAIDSLGTAPPNVLVRTHVPQLDVLQRAAAFVTHGGMNSVSESCFYGVPTIVIPQMGEQEIVGRRVAELGAGVFLAKELVTPEALRSAVERVLTDDTFRAKARAIGESFRASGGVGRAADLVLERTHRYRQLPTLTPP